MDMRTVFENIDVLLGSKNVNPIEKEIANTIKGSISNNDTEVFFHQRGNSSQDNETGDFSGETLFFGKIGYLSRWNYYQMRLICACRKKWTLWIRVLTLKVPKGLKRDL